MSDKAKGIIDTLKDLSFSEFITTRIIKLLYILGVILVTLSALGFIVTSFMRGFVPGIIGLIIGPIWFVLGVISVRVYLELVIVIFRIAENTGKMAGNSDPLAAPGKTQEKPASEKNSDKKEDKEEEKEEEEKEDSSEDESKLE